ncbi:MAG: acetate kinase [Mariprofundales bacterium]|nr:acetate kinase [Mariprofundales bacterium]
MSTILVINSGSSSIKMAAIAMPGEQVLAQGLAERLGEAAPLLTWRGSHQEAHQMLNAEADHTSACQQMLALLFAEVEVASVAAVGHRIVHGGEAFVAPLTLDAAAIAKIAAISHLAPLHNPANLLGIKAAMAALPDVPQVAVFDTAFHHTMPPHAYLYAVPHHWYAEYGVRRYGFHGTSHRFVAQEAAKRLQRAENDCHLLTAHLGNGCSAAAIAGGISVDTTMGLTPLEGLVMGTRSGDVDPGLHAFIARQSGRSLEEITNDLNQRSGLLGISGVSNDMRTLLAAASKEDAAKSDTDENRRAQLAIDIFCYRLAKALAGLSIALPRLDAIVFTGGIGEHAAEVRRQVVQQLHLLGVSIDPIRNTQHGSDSKGFISPPHGSPAVLVIPTSEERMIARDTLRCLNRPSTPNHG